MASPVSKMPGRIKEDMAVSKSLMAHTIKAAFENAVYLGALMIAILFASLPLTSFGSMFAFSGIDRFQYPELLEMAHVSDDMLATMPEALQKNVVIEEECLQRASSASSKQEEYAALADYYRAYLEDFENGYTSGDERPTLEAYIALYDALSKTEGANLYFSTETMPALYYAVHVFAKGSPAIWLLLPVVAAFLLLSALDSKKILGFAPVGQGKKFLAVLLISFCVSVLGMLVAFLPGFLVSLFKNGLGSFDYPAVFVQNGVACTLTIAQLLVRQGSLYLLACLFIILLALAVFAACKNALVAGGVCLAFALIPTISGYTGALSDLGARAELLSNLPTTYLSFGSITGYNGAFLAADILNIAGASFEKGLFVLAISCAILLAFVVLARKARALLRTKRRA